MSTRIIAGRFEILESAGGGGMGDVFRAWDRETDETVALKLLRHTMDGTARFLREGRVLATLEHPGIVRYVAHGTSDLDTCYLAMEWLDGEDLALRLQRGRLGLADVLSLGRRAAAALAAAHRGGVVHRDIKPANLFLVGGDPAAAKLLDFGIARPLDLSQSQMTASGIVVGTPGYMAPEQALGSPDVDGRADLFSLGCVMFACLAGRSPYRGPAALAKLVLDGPPDVRAVRDDVPLPVASLLMRLMATLREDRPADADEAVALFDSVDEWVAPARAPEVTTRGEVRLVSVVLGGAEPSREETVADSDLARADRALSAIAAGEEVRLAHLVDGSVAITVRGGEAMALAVRAARIAVAVSAARPRTPVVVATGRAALHGAAPVGEVVDRAAALLACSSAGQVRVDPLTAGLLPPRFDVIGDEHGLLLQRERDSAAPVRQLLGRTTPCVGRGVELRGLTALATHALSSHEASAALIVGPPGIGKSRLRYEVEQRLRRRFPALEVWLGHGDPLTRGSPFGVIAAALRSTFGLRRGEPVEAQRQRVVARVARNVPADRAGPVAEFLGELLGVPPVPGRQSDPLRAARHDPQLMADRLQHAFEELVAGETSAVPVLLVLEDLHDADRGSLELVARALGTLETSAWMVIGTGRPELLDRFPALWAGHGLQEVRLEGLAPRAAEQLALDVLGDERPREIIAQIVERAQGNPFFLEELIRAEAEGDGGLPRTILAVVEARLDRLDRGERDVLGAASVYGRTFWLGAVLEVLGPDRAEDVGDLLARLIERELVLEHPRSRYPGEVEYEFRHALVREAAYARLSDGARRDGHARAADWLEWVGDPDAVQLAEHLGLAGEAVRASDRFAEAALDAVVARDLDGALALATRALDGGASRQGRVCANLAKLRAHVWRGELVEVRRCAEALLAEADAGTDPHAEALAELATVNVRVGHDDEVVPLGVALLGDRRGPLSEAATLALARTARALLHVDEGDEARRLLAAAEEELARGDHNPVTHGLVHQVRAEDAMFCGERGVGAEQMKVAASWYERAGDRRRVLHELTSQAFNWLHLGVGARAVEEATAALSEAEALGFASIALRARFVLAAAHLQLGRPEEAADGFRRVVSGARASGDRRTEHNARLGLAMACSGLGRHDAALEHATEGCSLAGTAADFVQAWALGVLAQVHLEAGRADEALATCERSLRTEGERRGAGAVRVRLTYARALHRVGRSSEALSVVEALRDDLLAQAARLRDEELRESFLHGVPEHARVMELAARWSVG